MFKNFSLKKPDTIDESARGVRFNTELITFRMGNAKNELQTKTAITTYVNENNSLKIGEANTTKSQFRRKESGRHEDVHSGVLYVLKIRFKKTRKGVKASPKTRRKQLRLTPNQRTPCRQKTWH